ncbi:DnaD domain protein, partial [Streptococcus danieliae]|nr:DnaD domain protein [Streptococcus danieliae]
HYALNGLGKMHLGPIEMDIFRTDVREAISGDKDQEELIRLAIDEAARKKASSWQYVSTILKNWRVQGIKCVEDYDKVNRKRREEDLPEIPDWMGI